MDTEDEEYTYSDDDDTSQNEQVAARSTGEATSLRGSESRRNGEGNVADGAFSLLQAEQVEKMMGAKIAELANMLDMPAANAAALLRDSGWSSERLMEAFVNDAPALLERAGVDKWESSPQKTNKFSKGDPDVECRICCTEVPSADTLAAPCGHSFCRECYGMYLTNAIEEGPASVRTTCPEAKCRTLVPPLLLDQCLAEKRQAKYKQFCLGNFVSFSKNLRYCPSPGCSFVVCAGSGTTQVRCAGPPGGCGECFCMRCGEEGHQPVPCADMQQWQEKCQNESETANWILANTKRCPKCNTRIEKNQGCNHMNCAQCKHEFCWMCMGDWAAHGPDTGGYYKCNKFDPKTAGDDNSDQARAKRELDRYLHYYKRYHGHDQAQKFAVKQLQTTEQRMIELQESTFGKWIDVQFLKSANEMVVNCRRTLKATYIFGYYLPLDATRQRNLFENLQEHLERFTEMLSELTELPIAKMDRTEIVNTTRVTESFLANLIQGAESGLDIPDEEPAS